MNEECGWDVQMYRLAVEVGVEFCSREEMVRVRVTYWEAPSLKIADVNKAREIRRGRSDQVS